MRILIFTHAISRHENDHPQFINELCHGYRDTGHEVEILTASHYSIDKSRLDPTIKFSFYRYAPKKLEILGYGDSLENDLNMKFVAYLMAPLMMLMGLFALRNKIRTLRPDYVHAHWGLPNGFIAALALLGTRTPLVISFPGSDVTAIAMNPVLKKLGMFACRKASLLTTNSHDLRDTMVKLGADKEKFYFVLYGSTTQTEPSDPEIQGQLKRKYGITGSDKVILAIGRLVPKKGFRYLIEALPLLPAHLKYKVIIVGLGLEQSVLQEIVSRENLDDRVIFAGRVPFSQLPQYYHLADIFANPAVRIPVDGLNVVVPEAMKYQLPIAASNVGGNELVVREGENGYLVPEKDPVALATILSRMLTSDTDLAAMGKRSAALFHELASWDVIARQYTDLVRNGAASG